MYDDSQAAAEWELPVYDEEIPEGARERVREGVLQRLREGNFASPEVGLIEKDGQTVH